MVIMKSTYHLHMHDHKEPKRYHLNGTIRIVRQDIFDDIAHCSNECWKLQRIYSILNVHTFLLYDH